MNIVSVFIEITNYCNINCITCYNSSGISKEKQYMQYDSLANSIKILRSLGAAHIILAGGEPTLHPEFNNILDFPFKYPELRFYISTNGVHQSNKLIQIYNSASNLDIQVSLDGSCEEINSKSRGEKNFDKAVEFIRRLHPNGKRLLIKIVLSKNNINDVANFYKMVVSLGGTPEFTFVNNQGNATNNWDGLYVNGKEKFHVMSQVRTLNQQYKKNALLPLCTHVCPLADSSDGLNVTVKVDGSLMPCQLLYDEHFSLGNLMTDSIDHFESNLKRISDMAKKREENDFDCNKCIIRSSCKKGCMAAAYNIANDPFANDGECEFRKCAYIQLGLRPLAKGI